MLLCDCWYRCKNLPRQNGDTAFCWGSPGYKMGMTCSCREAQNCSTQKPPRCQNPQLTAGGGAARQSSRQGVCFDGLNLGDTIPLRSRQCASRLGSRFSASRQRLEPAGCGSTGFFSAAYALRTLAEVAGLEPASFGRRLIPERLPIDYTSRWRPSMAG